MKGMTGRPLKCTVFALLFSLASTAQGAGSAGLESDCPMFDANQVQALFPAASKLGMKSREKPYPTCTFTWASATPERRTIGNQVIESPGQGRLTLTRAVVKSATADWDRVLKSYGDETLQSVEDVGDRAVWSQRRSQISAQNAGFIVHVALSNPDAPDESLATAIEIAQQLLEP